MRCALTALIMTFILFIILVPMWLVFDNVMSPLENEVTNSTVLDAADQSTVLGIYYLIRNIFTLCFVITLCGIPVGYIVDRLQTQDYGGGYRG